MKYGIVNGAIGYVESVQHKDEENGVEEAMLVRFDNELVTRNRDQFDQLALAYCLTIHKSQGSKFQTVLKPVSLEHSITLQRRLLYTGTRAKEKLLLFGQREDVERCVNNSHEIERQTLLKRRITEA